MKKILIIKIIIWRIVKPLLSDQNKSQGNITLPEQRQTVNKDGNFEDGIANDVKIAKTLNSFFETLQKISIFPNLRGS